MYKKSVQGWLKHLDFMILDVVCLWISFTLAFNMRHGSLDVLANSLYRDMMWSLALMDIVVIFFFDSLKNVLKRGFYQEFVMTVKQTCLITLCSVFYLFTFKEAENYSRLVLGYTAALYLLLSYVLRCLWKNCLRKYFGGAEKRSLLIVTVSDIVDTVIDNIKNKNYGDYFVTGVCILDKKAKGRVIDGVTVVADEDDLVEYVCREWVDEVFINIPESEPYPAELLDKFIEMGVVVHMKLAKSQNLLGKKQFVEHLGTYTVLTTSINSVSRRQIILKRMMDIAGGLAGCIITGILCIFVGPAIYIQSPGPIFFKQTRVGKNGKLFQMYKFRSMYMDAEERKAELMKENRVQDGMMFKLDFDPRIIGSKKLPDGTIKKGVGNFIRDWSLDEFPQFLNVLKGDMSLVGTRPPTVDEWDKYELHHRARLATKPGLTGMWQVSGRSNITDFEEVVKLDKQYISEWTMGLDIKILSNVRLVNRLDAMDNDRRNPRVRYKYDFQEEKFKVLHLKATLIRIYLYTFLTGQRINLTTYYASVEWLINCIMQMEPVVKSLNFWKEQHSESQYQDGNRSFCEMTEKSSQEFKVYLKSNCPRFYWMLYVEYADIGKKWKIEDFFRINMVEEVIHRIKNNHQDLELEECEWMFVGRDKEVFDTGLPPIPSLFHR